MSQQAHDLLFKRKLQDPTALLTPRQREALSLCAAYPNAPTTDLARKLGIANSTVRNLLSSAYIRLEVNNRPAAVAKARQLGLITPTDPAAIFQSPRR